MSTPGSGNLNASTFSRNPNNFLQQFEQFTMVGWQKKNQKKKTPQTRWPSFSSTPTFHFSLFMICACVSSFGFFVSFVFVFWKWPTDGRAFRIADTTPAQLRDLQQTKHFRTGCPFIFTFFFFGFYLQNPASFSALGSWELTKENKMFRWCFCCFFGVQANLDLSLDPYYGQSAQQLLFGNCATVTNQKTTPQTPQTPSSIPDIVLQGGRSFFFFVIEPSTWNESSFHGTPIRRFLRLFFCYWFVWLQIFPVHPKNWRATAWPRT